MASDHRFTRFHFITLWPSSICTFWLQCDQIRRNFTMVWQKKLNVFSNLFGSILNLPILRFLCYWANFLCSKPSGLLKENFPRNKQASFQANHICLCMQFMDKLTMHLYLSFQLHPVHWMAMSVWWQSSTIRGQLHLAGINTI